MEGGLRVHELDLRQSLPTVLRAVEARFTKLENLNSEVIGELRRLSQLCNATQGLGDQCQETSVLKASVASACQGTDALKALVADVSLRACGATSTTRRRRVNTWVARVNGN